MDSTQDSTAWIPDSSYWIPNSLKVGLGFRIAVVRGIRDSLTCIPDSTSKNFPDSGICVQDSLTLYTGRDLQAKCQRNIYSALYLPLFPSLRLLLVCTWHHDGCVGGQEQKHFSPLETKHHFHVNSLRKNYIVLTTNMAASSRGCKLRVRSLFRKGEFTL